MNSIFSKNSFDNKGQSLIVLIIILVAVALLGGSYYYFSRQAPEVSEIPEAETPKISEEPETSEEVTEVEVPELPKEPVPEESVVKKPVAKEPVIGPEPEPITEPELTHIEGIILVHKNNNYSSFVKNLAKEKGWYLLETESSNAPKIRQDIISVTSRYGVDYLLIIGDEDQIPIADPAFLEKFLADRGLTRYDIGKNVLDSIYYGNINDDLFVELAVGRLPFKDEASIKNYFLNLEKNKNIQNVNAIRPLQMTPGVLPMIGVEKQFINFQVNNFISKSLNINQINNYLENSDLFLFFAHGSKDAFTVNGQNYHWNNLPDLNKYKPILISGACNTAREFGREFIRKGGTAFVGYYFEAEPDPNVFPIRPINTEESIGKSIRNVINKNITIYKRDPGAVFPSLYYLIGDPSIKINYPETNRFSKLALEEKEDRIIINVPPYEKDISYEVFDEGQTYFSIDGAGNSRILANLGMMTEEYQAIVNKKYFLIDDPAFVKYVGAKIYIECDPDGATIKTACRNPNDPLYGYGDYLERFDIVVPYEYAFITEPGGNFFIFELEKGYNISNFYLEVEEKLYSLSKFSNYEIVTGNQESFLVFELALNDFFDLIHNGNLFKKKKIILISK